MNSSLELSVTVSFLSWIVYCKWTKMLSWRNACDVIHTHTYIHFTNPTSVNW